MIFNENAESRYSRVKLKIIPQQFDQWFVKYLKVLGVCFVAIYTHYFLVFSHILTISKQRRKLSTH